MRIDTEEQCDNATLDVIRAGMRRYTESRVPVEEYTDVNFIARDDAGAVISCALGNTGRGWLYVDLLWVHEDHRSSGLGTKLMQTIEDEARRRGCHSAYLNTFSYQARPFYEKLGYVVFGTLKEFPRGHERYYMTKRL